MRLINVVMFLGYDNESEALKVFVKEVLPRKLGICKTSLRITEIHVPEFEAEDLRSLGLPIADIYINNRYVGSINVNDKLSILNEHVIKFVKILHDIVGEVAPLA